MNRIRPIRWLVLALLFFAGGTPLAQRPPNIVLLVGDDHGYPYFGFMGDENVVTPSMDALAAGGTTFSHAHVTATYCRPSLRTLITGLHPVQYVLRENEIVERRRSEDAGYEALGDRERGLWEQVEKAAAMREFETLPKLLGEAGYVSWQGGKWWENNYRNGHFTEGMSEGWDLSAYGGDGFFEELMGADGNDLVRETMEPVFDFIDRNREQPFFIWFAPSLPHVPFDAPYTYRKYYRDMDISESAKLYYSNVTWWDDGVGRLMDHIESHSLMDDTLFVYISDNGWEQEADVEYKVEENATIADDLLLGNGGDLGKNGLYDMSFRSPLVFHWRTRRWPRAADRTGHVLSLAAGVSLAGPHSPLVQHFEPGLVPGHLPHHSGPCRRGDSRGVARQFPASPDRGSRNARADPSRGLYRQSALHDHAHGRARRGLFGAHPSLAVHLVCGHRRKGAIRHHRGSARGKQSRGRSPRPRGGIPARHRRLEGGSRDAVGDCDP